MSKEKHNIADSPFFAFMGLLGDAVALGLLWLVCCLPVVTIGASTAAAFSVAGKMAANGDYFVRRDFFAALKRDFKQATMLWLGFAVAGVLLVADYQIGLSNSGSIGGVLIAFSAAGGICWVCLFGACFALLGRFAYPRARAVLGDAVRLCLSDPVAMLAWLALTLWMPVCYRLVPALYYYLRLPWLLVGGGACIVPFSFALRPFFKKLEHKDSHN